MKKAGFRRLVASIGGRQHRLGDLEPGRVTEIEPWTSGDRRRLRSRKTGICAACLVQRVTLQNWERGRRRPEGPARALLKVAAENPDAVWPALSR